MRDAALITNLPLVQISTLIIAPAFLAAACYIILGWLIHALGEEHSLLRPRVYIWLFVSGDVLSLVIVSQPFLLMQDLH